MSIAILVPVLGRPQNVAPFLRAVEESTTESYRVLWICDPGDTAEQDAIAREGGWMISPGGTYASKINDGIDATDEPLILLAADDVQPRSGWLQAAIDAMAGGTQVVGLNDRIPRLHRPGHATHFLMTREYAARPCIDGSRGPLHQGYSHWCVDDELIGTATKRGVYAYARGAIVEHVGHPMLGGADDETYQKGRATARPDRKRFLRREHLWA